MKEAIVEEEVRREDVSVKEHKKRSKRVIGRAWGEQQRTSFDHIKRSICENVMVDGDSKYQYHVAANASQRGLGGVVFQLPGTKPGTIMERKYAGEMRIVMCIVPSFGLKPTRLVKRHPTRTMYGGLGIIALNGSVVSHHGFFVGAKWSGKRPGGPRCMEAKIKEAGIAGAFVFSDGSLLESGKVGGGAFVGDTERREKEVACFFYFYFFLF